MISVPESKLDLASNPNEAPPTSGAAKALVKGLALVDLVAAHGAAGA